MIRSPADNATPLRHEPDAVLPDRAGWQARDREALPTSAGAGAMRLAEDNRSASSTPTARRSAILGRSMRRTAPKYLSLARAWINRAAVPGDALVTNRRPILTLIEDTSPGVHDT